MDKLVSLYEQLKKLRDAGVKMKDISEETNITSSVLSSLYSSVLPAYINSISGGNDSDYALNNALQQVNNVSKRKLLGCLDELYDKVCHIEPRLISGKSNSRPFLDDIEKESIKYLPNAGIYTGLYQSYSASSYADGLKVEPYMISSIAEGLLPEYGRRLLCRSRPVLAVPDWLSDVQRAKEAAARTEGYLSATAYH